MDKEEITLTEYIKSRDFNHFQWNIFTLPEFDGFIGDLGDKLDDIDQLEDVFLLQKKFYEDFEVYLVFPIAAKFIYEKATDMDCTWCWNSKKDLGERIIKEFMEYLNKLIENYHND